MKESDNVFRTKGEMEYNNYFNDAYQGIPIGGYSKLMDRLLAGVECKTNTDFFNSEYRERMNFAKELVYAGPFDEYFDYKYGKPDWRSVTFKTKKLDTPNHHGNEVTLWLTIPPKNNYKLA